MVQGVLSIVYRQSLIWAGMPFCPVLPLVGMLSNVVFFYVHAHIVMHTCVPPIKRWNQTRNNATFLGVLALTFVMILMPQLIALYYYQVRHTCSVCVCVYLASRYGMCVFVCFCVVVLYVFCVYLCVRVCLYLYLCFFFFFVCLFDFFSSFSSLFCSLTTAG